MASKDFRKIIRHAFDILLVYDGDLLLSVLADVGQFVSSSLGETF